MLCRRKINVQIIRISPCKKINKAWTFMQFNQKGHQKANQNPGTKLSQQKKFRYLKRWHNKSTKTSLTLRSRCRTCRSFRNHSYHRSKKTFSRVTKNKHRRKEDNDEEQVTRTIITHRFEFQGGAMIPIYNTIEWRENGIPTVHVSISDGAFNPLRISTHVDVVFDTSSSLLFAVEFCGVFSCVLKCRLDKLRTIGWDVR